MKNSEAKTLIHNASFDGGTKLFTAKFDNRDKGVSNKEAREICKLDGHSYSRFGRYQETCIRCGSLHPMVVIYRDTIAKAFAAGKIARIDHPYLSLLISGGKNVYGEDRPWKNAWCKSDLKKS